MSRQDGWSEALYRFTPKHRQHVKLNFMSGVALPGWLRFLRRHWRHIDWRLYWHRVAFLSCMAVVNSCLGIVDQLRFGRQIRDQALNPAPLIILGHPRSGTTLLHNLLSQDPSLAYVTTFAAGCPQFFVSADPIKALWSPLLEPRRPMDAMLLDWDTPAEDELATSVLCGGLSPYMALVLPREEARCFRQYFTFEGAAPEEAAAWERSFLWVLRKATFFAARRQLRARGAGAGAACTPPPPPPPPLVIKSPVHTARVALLLRLFPNARFVYIHRHPLEVFQSAAHMADTYYWYTYLQAPTDAAVTRFIVEQFELLWDEYQAQKGLIPPGHLLEVSFAQLEADPLGTMRGLYHAFRWRERWEAVAPVMQRYCSSLDGFTKNQHNSLSPELQQLVRRRWAAAFEAFGYS